jgi:cytidylate kinase
MKEQTREQPGILAAAERQMHAWALNTELKERESLHEAEGLLASQAVKYVTISREAGASGGEIGRLIGERLGWEVYDKNLLDRIADRFHLSRTMLDLVDETHRNWVYDVFGSWMDHRLVPHQKYVACLGRVVLAIARRGPAIFVGRGVQFLLPRKELLAVRMVAAPNYRLRKIMEIRSASATDARRYMANLDRDRQEFVEQFFHRDVADPHQYDLVINVDRLGTAGAVKLILAAMGR